MDERTRPDDTRMGHNKGEAPSTGDHIYRAVHGSHLEVWVQRILVFGTEGQVELVRRQELQKSMSGPVNDVILKHPRTAEKG